MDIEHVGVGLKRRSKAGASAPAESTNVATTEVKRRRIGDGGSRVSSPCVTMGNNSAPAQETSAGTRSVDKDVFGIPRFDDDLGSTVSCCSSNCSGEELDEKCGFVEQPKEDGADVQTSTYCGCSERRNMTSSKGSEESDGAESTVGSSETTAKILDAKSPRRSSVKRMKSVSEAELELFFSEAEKVQQRKLKEFTKKYNFDFVKEAPLGGRYEWFKLKD